jgi:hypothetical protein
MEIADIKRQVVETINRARRRAAERRTRMDEGAKAYETFLNHHATPVFRQVANVLRSEGYPFSVFTPGGSVRLASERAPEDYIELAFDATGDEPMVVGHTKRGRGRRIVESERAVGEPTTLNEQDVLAYVLNELEPFVER